MKNKRILWTTPSFSLGDLAFRLRCGRVLAQAGFSLSRLRPLAA